MKLTEDDFDSRYVKTWEWTADDKLRRFRIFKHDGTIKEILFSEILQNQKLRELIEKKIRKLARSDYTGKWYLDEWRKILADSKINSYQVKS